MTDKKRNLFVTTALPYANGPFHIGHIMEYIQADIWVRHERMCGNNVHWVGADDTHGAPIMIAAQKKGITPQQFVAEIAAGRKEYLDDFYIKFDFWHSTDSPENHELSQDIYRRLKAAGLIYTKDIEQFYDTEKNMFLADRFIKGTCPKCGAEDQYGDSCEVCGSVYAPTDLKNPKSALSGTTPVIKKSTHYFFKLSDPRAIEFLREWTRGNGADGKPRVQPEVLAKDEEWLGADGGMADWDISRDAPYFGIEIPDAPGKYFYVWLDAPVGYLASFKAFCAKAGLDFEKELTDPSTEQIHFIGKDIIYFHTLFWPAMLKFAGKPYRVPDHVNVHGFVTVDGRKMSKSRGNVINPDDTIAEIGADAFRMYEMFMGAFDQAIPWSTQSAKGCRRFLDRVWRLQENVTPDEGYSEKLNALMHETIKKVSLDYEAMKYNTAIAQMMTLVNEMVSVGSVTRGELKTLLLLLNPVAPHITEEMWENQGFGGTMTYQKWPTWDEDALVKSEIEIAVQVCGKVRGRVMIPADMTKERAETELQQLPEIQKILAGKTVTKVIFVPGRLVNFIAK